MQDTAKGHILRGKTIGFVPTMGALHEGHMSLIRRAKQENQITVVSIFVNPIQFGPSEDFHSYPRDIERDTERIQKEDVDILFFPEALSMYPQGFSTYVEVEKISERLCGAFRPGHFKGVSTVVTKLLNIVKPSKSYFGQKDFQQVVIIKHLVRDLDMDIDIIVCPTIRERDGLAMSSRNAYLDKKQRAAATVIYRSFQEASKFIQSGTLDLNYVRDVMVNTLRKESLVISIDYAGIYDPGTLVELSEIKGDVLLAVALKIGNTRLIDNMVVNTSRKTI
jgi:pantoate--beta-alanine ligase